jgi:hypothetical protein
MLDPHVVFFYDQEPLYSFIFEDLDLHPYALNQYKVIKLLANSEHSELKNKIIKDYKFVDWYYFFHGFAALEWYRDFQFYPRVEKQFTKVFISLNHLSTKDRSYRLTLVANYIEKDILTQGYVSLHATKQDIKDELFSPISRLSIDAKKLIAKKLITSTLPIIADTNNGHGALSANLNLEDSALWNIVSETIFYDQKLHLTEKIFKPIVARRPFILVAAPGNLAYIKSYGFKTFDRWIDESYDLEQDPDRRIELITQELATLCAMSNSQLQLMYQEMQEVLDYNFNHFYGEFKKTIVNEMIDNLESAFTQINNGRLPNNHSRYHQRFEYPPDYLQEVKQRFLK